MSFSDEIPKFQVWDYVVFSLPLAISAGIGVFYAFTGGRQSTTKEFLLADKSMNVLPVAMSMLASFMSAITLMGNPAEIYNYGTQFVMIGLSYALVIPAAAHLYIPVFYNLNLTSVYELVQATVINRSFIPKRERAVTLIYHNALEDGLPLSLIFSYLELRFSKGVRLAACLTFITQMVLYMAIVLYAPALALNQVTGLNVWISVLSVGIVCTFYTALGGMKAVMWTDFVQIFIMFSGMITILVKGTIDAGGAENVWQLAKDGDRLELFNFDPDPRTRHTFWTLTFGATFTWLAIYAVNQAQVQRALSTPSLRSAQTAYYLNIPGLIGLLLVTTGCGLVIYANFKGCDPKMNGQVAATDQLVPLFVMKSLHNFPGLPGLFVSAIFSGALSTLSSGFNSLSAITLQDIIRSYWCKNITEKRATLIAKVLAVGYGIFCIGLSYVASYMGSILQAALALFGMVGGPLLGLFTLAIFFPWANWKGAYAALFGSLTMTLWIGFGGIVVYPPVNPILPLSIENCTSTISTSISNVTMYSNMSSITSILSSTAVASNPPASTERPPVAELYAISYLYYSVIAVTSSIIFGLVVSFITGAQDPKEIDPRLITPIISKIFCCVPTEKKKVLWCGVRHDQIPDDEEVDSDKGLYRDDTEGTSIELVGDSGDGLLNAKNQSSKM